MLSGALKFYSSLSAGNNASLRPPDHCFEHLPSEFNPAASAPGPLLHWSGVRGGGCLPVLCLRAIEIVHWGVEPGEDGWGDVKWQLLVEELLLLRFAHEHSVIHGHMLATRFRVHCQVLKVRHSWKDKRTDGRLTPALALLCGCSNPFRKGLDELCSSLLMGAQISTVRMA